MAENVPSRVEVLRNTFIDSDGTYLSEGTELRAATGSALEPNDKGDSVGGGHNIVTHSSEEIIKHAGCAFGVIPINLLITWSKMSGYLHRLGNEVRFS